MSPLNYYMVRQSTPGLYTFEFVVVVAAWILVVALWRATGDARPLAAYAIGGFYNWGIELMAAASGTRTITPVELFGVLPVGFPLLQLILGFFEGGVLILAAFELTRGIREGNRRSLAVGVAIVAGLGVLIGIGALATAGLREAAPPGGAASPLTVRALFTPGSLALLAACAGITAIYVFGVRRGDPRIGKGLLAWYGAIIFAGSVWYTPVFLSGTRKIAALVDGSYQPVGAAEQIAVFWGFSLLCEAAGFYLPVYVLVSMLGLFDRRREGSGEGAR